MNIFNKRNILILVLFITAFFLRSYSLTNTAEFLGDQGRDGLAIMKAIGDKALPLTGPTVGAGYYTGPFYYYLISPSYLLFPKNPIAPVIEICVISCIAIVLFLYVASQLFGFQTAYVVSLLWAISPMMIMQDKRLWNPTPIPFFVLLLVASILWVFRQKKHWGYISAAIASSVLIQLHYVNAISIIFISGIWIIFELMQWRQKRKQKSYIWMVCAIGTIIVCNAPFVWYESQHTFGDITGSITTFMHGSYQVFSKRAYVLALGEVTTSVWKYVVVVKNYWMLLGIAAGVLFLNAIKRKTETTVLALWFFFGVTILAFYKDTIQPQYWYQLIPVVYLLLAGVLSGIHKRMIVIVSVSVVVLASCVSWSFIHPYKVEDPDVPRITAITEKIATVMENKTFAFTVMHSRSFNDLHFRYFFTVYGIKYVPIDDVVNKQLLIICENGCLDKPIEKVSIMCGAEICPLDKPTVPVEWQYEKTERVGNSALYFYRR